MSPSMLLLAILPAIVTAASVASLERMPTVVHDPCLSVGHWVQFDTRKCGDEASSLMPVIMSQDGKTRLVAEQGQPKKICVQPMHFSGHAFLESAGLGEWQDSLLQYVNFTFKAFPDETHFHKASYVKVDVGPDGGQDLQTAAPFTSGLFWSTPRNAAPLSPDSAPEYTVTGTKSYDLLHLTWCGNGES